MRRLSSSEVRKLWLDFFAKKGHQVIPSKNLIPVNDPSLLWINSGVAALKEYFTGKKLPPSPRLTNSQKSIRTNDIENVGVTARHHTLFEMLGNFSIGDYFRDEALEWACELLFGVFGFDREKIYITYFADDENTYKRWLSLGINESHLIKGDRKTNFWDVGQGPCGPCTEIFYDRGEKYDEQKVGIRLLKEDIENDRYIEIWNIVFSQYNNDGANNYEELRQKNIDTGAGLERIVSIFQDAPTNFDTDLFLPIIHDFEKTVSLKYDIQNYFTKDANQQLINKNFRIIADHIRAVSLAIEDGAVPSNNLRGYIIRRLIRRTYRAGKTLGNNEDAFLYKLVPVVSKTLAFLNINIEKVQSIIMQEELAFAKTIVQGQNILAAELAKHKKVFPFEVAFKLFETYGFPIELTQEILAEKNIDLDISQFDDYLSKHANLSRGKKVFGMENQVQIIQSISEKLSDFVGYDDNNLSTEAEVIFQGQENDQFYVLLSKTPFYATGGGQAHDLGIINNIKVKNVFKDKFGNHWHILDQEIKGKKVLAQVDKKIRLAKERNHSATHLLNSALRDVFGKQVVQLGSENDERRLRFDFPLEKRPSSEELKRVEKLVNDFIAQKHKRLYLQLSKEEANKTQALSLENEEYGDVVRVVDLGISQEFCGGVHVQNTGDIECFKITRFESKAANVYRIEAITSLEEVKKFEDVEMSQLQDELKRLINNNKTMNPSYTMGIPKKIDEVLVAIEKAKVDNKELNKKQKDDVLVLEDISFTAFKGMKTYINLEIKNEAQIKSTIVNLREKFNDALIILGSWNESKPKMTIALASKKFNVKDIFDEIAKAYNGKGGGNPEFVMGVIDKVKELNA